MPARRSFLYLLATLSIFKLVCPYRLNLVVGESMEPNLSDGQICLVDTRAYRHRPPQRGDVVVALLDQEICVKRVYALPGDTFWLLHLGAGRGLSPIVLGAKVPRSIAGYVSKHGKYARLEKVEVPRGCLYLVGDNYQRSMDSRDLGWGYEEDLLGKVIALRPPRPAKSWTPPPPPAQGSGA